MAGLLTALTGLPWLLAFMGPGAGGILVGAGVISLIAVSVLFINEAYTITGTGLYKALAIAAIIVAAMTLVGSYLASQATRMETAGHRHTVTVVAERENDHLFQRGTEYLYQLSDGVLRLPGELTASSDLLDPGDTIEVYTVGSWHELASTVDDGRPLRYMLAGGYLLSLPLGMATGYCVPIPKRRGARGRHSR